MNYIDKNKLIAEIERYKQGAAIARFDNAGENADYFQGKVDLCDDLTHTITSLQQEQPEGLHFTPLNRLIQKIPSENWNDTVNNYVRKLRDCLIREGYRKDAEVLQDYISYMNGNNVPMATMDEQEQLGVQNGKFVFPKYLYARTKDNKTIDMSYVPQDMTAIEYVRNDLVQQEQSPKGYDEAYLNECIAKASKTWKGVDADKYLDEMRGREQDQLEIKSYIEELLKECAGKDGEYYRSRRETLAHLFAYLGGNPSEYMLQPVKQPEVNLEKEITRWLCEGDIADINFDDYDDADIEKTARHFYEFGKNSK